MVLLHFLDGTEICYSHHKAVLCSSSSLPHPRSPKERLCHGEEPRAQPGTVRGKPMWEQDGSPRQGITFVGTTFNNSFLIALLGAVSLMQSRCVPSVQPSSSSWEVTHIVTSVGTAFFSILKHLCIPSMLVSFIALCKATLYSFFTLHICICAQLLLHKWLNSLLSQEGHRLSMGTFCWAATMQQALPLPLLMKKAHLT